MGRNRESRSREAAGRGNSPEAAPEQKRGGKGGNVPRQFIRLTERPSETAVGAREAKTFPCTPRHA